MTDSTTPTKTHNKIDGCIPKSIDGCIPEGAFLDWFAISPLGIQRNFKVPNFELNNQSTYYTTENDLKKTLFLTQKHDIFVNFSTHFMPFSLSNACENVYPYSGFPVVFSLIILASQRLDEPQKRRLNGITIGRSGIGKEMVTIYPEALGRGKQNDTIVRKFDRPTIRGFEIRAEHDQQLFKNKVHIYPDLTTLETFSKNIRNAWFSYMNRRLETEYVDDSTFFAKPMNIGLKTGIINFLGCCTPEYIKRLRYNSKEGLVNSTYWDRILYYNHELTQQQIDVGDAYLQHLKSNKNKIMIEIPNEIKALIKAGNSFKRYEVNIPEKQLQQLMQLRNIIFLSKTNIREISHKTKDKEGKTTDEWIETIQTAETRRSSEQAEMLVKSIALLKEKKMKNTRTDKTDFIFALNILEKMYFTPNKYWKVYYYMNKYCPWVTYTTFTENENSMFKLSRMSAATALDKLIELDFVKKTTKKDSSHENIFHLTGKQYEI